MCFLNTGIVIGKPQCGPPFIQLACGPLHLAHVLILVHVLVLVHNLILVHVLSFWRFPGAKAVGTPANLVPRRRPLALGAQWISVEGGGSIWTQQQRNCQCTDLPSQSPSYSPPVHRKSKCLHQWSSGLTQALLVCCFPSKFHSVTDFGECSCCANEVQHSMLDCKKKR